MLAMDASVSETLETACHSDIGAREEQQDRVTVLSGAEARLLVLADGLGGHSGGALAAQAVIDVARERFEATAEENTVDLLTGIVRTAHERICSIGDDIGASPHSTCVLLYIAATEALWTHVGDSRLYLFDAGRLAARTLDHSVVELMRLQGRIDEEQMKRHPDQNRLYEALGGDRPPEVETDETIVSSETGFLLASDGLWENVFDEELEAIFGARNLTLALTNLVGRAKVRGGPECDNVTVAAARFGRSGATS